MTSWIGTGVSGTFLYLIAALNIVILWGILKVFREMRERPLRRGGARAPAQRARADEPLLRALHRARSPSRGTCTRSGVLFGLGFDTATEVALLFLAAGAAGAGLPFYAILCLPILFAAGMSLLDTIDGSFMNFAYGWAFSKPVRKVFYNLTDHGAVGRRRADRSARSSWSGSLAERAACARRVLDLAREHQHQHARLHHRRHVRRHLGDRAG